MGSNFHARVTTTEPPTPTRSGGELPSPPSCLHARNLRLGRLRGESGGGFQELWSGAFDFRNSLMSVFRPSQRRRSFLIGVIASSAAGSTGECEIVDSTGPSSGRRAMTFGQTWTQWQLMLEATVEALVAGQHPPSEGRFVSGEGLSSPSMRSRSSLPAERWAAHRAVQCRGRGVRSLTRPLRMSGTFVDRRSTMGAVRSRTASSSARASRWDGSLRPPRNDRRGRNEMIH